MSTNDFCPRAVREEPVREVGRDEIRTAHLVFHGADGFEVAIPERLLARAIAIGKAHAPLEWLGQLVGLRCLDAGGPHVVIEAIVQDVGARREPHFVTSTVESEARTRALAREQFPDAVVVGWIHGHVRHGAQYSRHDFKNQATWTDPNSIGVVVDPWDDRRLAVYRGPKGERLTQQMRPAQPHATAPDASTDPPTSRRRRARRIARQLLIVAAAIVVGGWMGRNEARMSVLERSPLHAAEQRHRAPSAAPSPGDSPRYVGVCAREGRSAPVLVPQHPPGDGRTQRTGTDAHGVDRSGRRSGGRSRRGQGGSRL